MFDYPVIEMTFFWIQYNNKIIIIQDSESHKTKKLDARMVSLEDINWLKQIDS